jgi:hypothetical protein
LAVILVAANSPKPWNKRFFTVPKMTMPAIPAVFYRPDSRRASLAILFPEDKNVFVL